MNKRMTGPLRHLVLVLGDQLDEDASALADFDPALDAIWMAEVDEESRHVISSKQRTTVFLSAMRHFAQRLQDKGWSVLYSAIDAPDNTGTLAGELTRTLTQTPPQALVMTAKDAVKWSSMTCAMPWGTLQQQLVLTKRPGDFMTPAALMARCTFPGGRR